MQLVAHSQSNVVTQTFDMQSLSGLRGTQTFCTPPKFFHEMENGGARGERLVCA